MDFYLYFIKKLEVVKICVIATIFLFFFERSLAQDPSFSQIDNSLSYYHSSYNKLKSGLGVSGVYRNQWSQIPGGFTTYWMHFDYMPSKKNTGFGLNLLSDTEGAAFIKTQRADAIIRQKLPVRIKKLRRLYSVNIGAYAGIQRKSIDWSKLLFSDQIDPVFGIYQPSSQLKPEINNSIFYDCGLSLTTEWILKLEKVKLPIDLHFSYNHFITRGEESLQGLQTSLPKLFVATLTTTVQHNTFYNTPLIKPSLQYEHQANVHRIKFGSLAGYIDDINDNSIYFGVYYSSFINTQYAKNAYALIPTLGVEKTYRQYLISLTYSYDMNLAGINFSNSGGVHEISFSMSLNTGNKKFNIMSNVFKRCPDF
jgi:type IX secretion system PorP/SprF family membrane protein